MGCRFTLAGPSKVGVTIRLPIGEDLQLIVQDNLINVDNFGIIAEGHLVDHY